jgi:aminoglycoside phosphotransferase (APT) family kinase protein
VLLGGGSSKQNWAFDATWGAGAERRNRELILRQNPAEGVVTTSLAEEFALLRALSGTGVPAPAAHWLDADAAAFALPSLVVDRARGRTDRAALREGDPLGLGPDGRLSLARQLTDLLADVHAVHPDRLAGIPDDPDPAFAALEARRAELATERAAAGTTDPRLDAALAWLTDRVPGPPPRRVLVHGDFRPANVLVADGRVSALLDWELAHRGDPHDDLGWYTCAVYRREHFVEGQWEREQFLARYTERSGIPVDAHALQFWQVLAAFRLTVIAARAVRLLAEGSPMGREAPVDRLLALLEREIS